MKDMIKEVALDIANKLDPERARLGGDFQFGFNTVQLFAELVVAELSKRAEAVGFCHIDAEEGADCFQAWADTYVNIPVFTFQPIHDIEEIENRTAEACAKLQLERSYARHCSDKHGDAEALLSGEWRKYK